MKYIGKNLSKSQLRVLVRELRTIEKQHGMVTPEAVVNAAEPKGAPLHRYFEWDDAKAASGYRLWQARQLVARVYVKLTDNPEEEPVLRAFVNVTDTVEGEDEEGMGCRGYVGVDVARSRASFKIQVVQYAYDQLCGWKKRFGAFKQFMGVSDEIGKVKL